MTKETEITFIPKGIHATQHNLGGIDPIAPDVSQLDNADLQSYENLLINGDFEIGDPPISWTVGGIGATLSRSNAQRIINAYSALFTRVGNDCNLFQRVEDFVRYRGRILTLGCWIWASVADRARLCIYDGATETFSSFHTGGSTWEWLTVTKILSAGAGECRAQGQILTDDTAAYFDGAILVEGSICPAFSPKPAELVIEETQIYAAAPPVAWTDLDISAILGIEIGSALVMLKHTETANVLANIIAVRRNGDIDPIINLGLYNLSNSSNQINSTGFGVVMCFTDENGVIEWKATNANAVTLDVMGYIKC